MYLAPDSCRGPTPAFGCGRLHTLAPAIADVQYLLVGRSLIPVASVGCNAQSDRSAQDCFRPSSYRLGS